MSLQAALIKLRKKEMEKKNVVNRRGLRCSLAEIGEVTIEWP